MKLETAAVSCPGRGRRENHDRVLVERSCFAVADGVGHLPGGDVAAQIAIDTLWAFSNHTSQVDLALVFETANRSILAEAASNRSCQSAATTMTAVQVDSESYGSFARIAHVGDSRCYLIRNGQVIQVTDDHVLETAAFAPRPSGAALRLSASSPSRALGMSPTLDMAFFTISLEKGDRVLLCTDGVTDQLTGDDLGRIASQSAKPGDLADRLAWSALSAGGRGDVSAIVIEVGRSGARPDETPLCSNSPRSQWAAA